MIPLSRPRRRRLLLMGDPSIALEASDGAGPLDDSEDDGGFPTDDVAPPPGGGGLLTQFRRDCGLSGKFEIQVRWPGQSDWQSAAFDSPFVMIGRDPGCGIVLDHDDISRRHACVQIVDGIPTICDLGSRNGIRKQGRLVSMTELRGADSVNLGPFAVRVAMPHHGEPASQSCADRIGLDFVNHRRRGGVWEVDRSLTILGSSRPSKVRLEHPSVSRVHCMLVRGSQWWVVNLGSQVGTLVNEKFVEFSPISLDTELRVGRFRIRIQAPSDSDTGADTSIMKSHPRNGSSLLTELTRSTLATRESRSRRGNPGINEEVVLAMFREFATLHERTLTQLQQTFREMLDVAVSHRTPALPSTAPAHFQQEPPQSARPVESAPLEEDAPNLAVVNLSLHSDDHEEREAAQELLAAQLRTIGDTLEGERNSFARRLLKTLSLGR